MVSDAVQVLVDKLNEFADSMDEVRRQAHAATWYVVFSLVLLIPTIGLGVLFSAAVVRIAQLVTQILSRLPGVLGPATLLVNFGLPVAFWSGMSAVVDIGAQLIGQSIANAKLHIDPTSVIINTVLGGLQGVEDGLLLHQFRRPEVRPPTVDGTDGGVAPPVPQVRPVPPPPPSLSPNASSTTVRPSTVDSITFKVATGDDVSVESLSSLTTTRPPSTVDSTRPRSRCPVVMTVASRRCRF